jgi:hypothetical protein
MFCMVMLSAPAVGEEAGQRSSPEENSTARRITILLTDYARVPGGILAGAKREVTSIFRDIGIEIVWVECTGASRGEPEKAVCFEPLRPTSLVIRIHPKFHDAGGTFRDSTLGFALLSAEPGRSAYGSIFYDYVEELAKEGVASHAQILGHGIAHELGHLLLGRMGHSSQGLMRARWDRADLKLATVGRLPFSSEEAETIRREVEVRARLEEQTRQAEMIR